MYIGVVQRKQGHNSPLLATMGICDVVPNKVVHDKRLDFVRPLMQDCSIMTWNDWYLYLTEVGP